MPPALLGDGAELKPGQIGRVTILKETTLFKLDGRNLEPVRQLHPGEVYRVYSAKTPDGYVPMYGVDGEYYVVQNVYPNNNENKDVRFFKRHTYKNIPYSAFLK